MHTTATLTYAAETAAVDNDCCTTTFP